MYPKVFNILIWCFLVVQLEGTAVDVLSLEVFRVRLDGVLGSLV